MNRCYVYALADGPAPRIRVGGRTVQSLRVGAVYAAVTRMDSLPSMSEATLAHQHEAVAKISARVDAILPMRFGALVDQPRLEQLIIHNQRTLSAALDLVRGRAQMTVRVFGPARPARSAVKRSEALSGTEYLLRRGEAARPRPLPRVATLIRRTVREYVRAERTDAGEGVLHATLWHLIERGTERQYRRALGHAAGKVSPFRVTVSGPWPPFAFAPELHE